MNERITLLALKASDQKTGWLDRQKFAKLIVAECASKVDSDLRDWLHDNSGETIGDKLKEHFGVEE